MLYKRKLRLEEGGTLMQEYKLVEDRTEVFKLKCVGHPKSQFPWRLTEDNPSLEGVNT